MVNGTDLQIIAGKELMNNPSIITIIGGGFLIGLIIFIVKTFSSIMKVKNDRDNLLRSIDGSNLLSYIKREFINLSSKNLNISQAFIWIGVIGTGFIFINVIFYFRNNNPGFINNMLQLYFASLGFTFGAVIIEKTFIDMEKLKSFSGISDLDKILKFRDIQYSTGLGILNERFANLTESQKKVIAEALAKQIIEKEKNKDTEAP